MDGKLDALRREVEAVNLEVLSLLSRRGALVEQIRRVKEEAGAQLFDPGREEQMLADVIAANPGPYPDETIRHLFREIFHASLDLMERKGEQAFRVSREVHADDLVLTFANGARIGAEPVVIAGPCAVESEPQLDAAASWLKSRGVRFLRAGAYKPRTSPYAFQGLGLDGLRILQSVCRRHDLVSVTEVLDTRDVALVAEHADVLQVGTRNMSNFALLRELGGAGRPVLLKRGMNATIDEWVAAAEYVVLHGNEQVVLCERGIRTFEYATRNTLDISAVPIMRQRTWLPVIVDVSHAAGRKDILAALARAAIAAGAQGVMVEVHPAPHTARSDADQQLSLPEFDEFLRAAGLDGR